MVVLRLTEVDDGPEHETARRADEAKNDHHMHGELGEQRPEKEIAHNGAGDQQKMSHLSPSD
jgi:hypothetical protein